MRPTRPWREATLWIACTGAFFIFSYAFADWAAAQHSAVPSVVFAWERHTPFLPWTIVPYWSTDLLYVISFLLCATRDELRRHVKRLLATQIFCVLVFLAFPLRFSFSVPSVDGSFRPWFAALGSFDRPFNQAPSLHLALTTILWSKYSDHSHGLARFGIRAWFVITAISTLTTYQHHFLDLPTGIWVGLFCIMVFPESAADTLSQRRSLRLGALYLSVAIGCIALAIWLSGLGWLLLWPAGALLLVSMAYFSGSSRFLGYGKMGFASVVLLAPYLLGTRINSWAWTRGEVPADEIAEGVWLGRSPRRRELPQITSFVHLAPEVMLPGRKVPCRRVPMLDLVIPSGRELDAAVEAIEELRHERPTLVCCALGRSRSACAVAAWLVATDAASSVDSAIALVGSRRRVILNEEHRTQLETWALTR